MFGANYFSQPYFADQPSYASVFLYTIAVSDLITTLEVVRFPLQNAFFQALIFTLTVPNAIVLTGIIG